MTQQTHAANALDMLLAEHRELDLRIKKLERRGYLTPEQQLEAADMKKRKLRAKDEIEALRAR